MNSRNMLVIVLLVFVCAGASANTLKTDQEKFSYAVGVQIAASLRHDGPKFNVEVLTQAIKDVLGGNKLALSKKEMQQAFQVYQQKVMKVRTAKAEKNAQRGKAYLASNKKKAGVVTLPSGLQYQVIKAGTGKKPKLDDTVTVQYRGVLIDGKEFDSSYKRGQPATFPVNGVIKGWQEILPLMKTGAHWKVFVPAELAYGSRGAGSDIGPNETLVFDIELQAIK